MGLYLTRIFQKKFLKLPKRTRSQIEEAIHKIYQNPRSGKKLTGELEGEISYRIGDYGIMYYVDEDRKIWIETVGHRKDVYKKKA